MARSRTSLRLLAATGILSLLPLSGLWMWKRGGPMAGQSTLVVKRGTTVDALADRMERDGLIRSAALFKLWARARKLQLIRGEYAFEPRASLSDVANKLKRADIHYTAITLPVGVHAWSVQHRLRDFVPADVFWALWKSPVLARTAGFPEAESLEGLLAPATYRVNHAMEPEEILLAMVESFRDKVLPTLEGGALPPYETLILASMTEKETREPGELGKVAGVYAQRLRIGMRLQCDPTAQYARWMAGDLRFTAPASEDLHRPSRFNTYFVKGLPPTPIALPGAAAIQAAKVPQLGKDLYFVATGHGGHSFAPSLGEHNRNVGAYRREVKRQKRALVHG